MQRRTVIVVALVACCALAIERASADTGPLQRGHRPCPRGDLDGVVARVNDIRARAGLDRVASDRHLDRYASTRSASMAAARVLSHRGWERGLRRAGLTDAALGENVAYNYETPGTVVAAWMRSPGHRANILRPIFRRVGVGCVIDERGHKWWTQDFAG